MTVGEYEPPHYSKIAILVKNLCDDLEERLKHIPLPKNEEQFLAEVISLLAWFQHRFVWIHPFKDYNGRVARLLTNLLFLNFGLPALEIKAETGRDRQNYIKAMKAADNNDYSKARAFNCKYSQRKFRKSITPTSHNPSLSETPFLQVEAVASRANIPHRQTRSSGV